MEIEFTEIEDVFDETRRDTLVTMNVFKHLGTLLTDLVEIDECFYYWDGRCAGEKLGDIMTSLLNTEIEADYSSLTGN